VHLVDVGSVVDLLEQRALHSRSLDVDDRNRDASEPFDCRNDAFDPLGMARRCSMLQAQFVRQEQE
jgi:hypothetical protein